MKRYPEPHGHVTAYNRSPVHVRRVPCREAPHRQPMHRQRRFVYQNIRNQQGFIFILFPSIFMLPFRYSLF